ncbi:hypothetical protein GJ496_001763 [Pomphorhynchus laevis]|nr:hypothetical protein GJ496_001763 [Pomphorhynchus laevis]
MALNIPQSLAAYLDDVNSNNNSSQQKFSDISTDKSAYKTTFLRNNNLSTQYVAGGSPVSNFTSEMKLRSTSEPSTITTDSSPPKIEEYFTNVSDSHSRKNSGDENNQNPVSLNRTINNQQALFEDWPTAEPPLVVNKPNLQNVVFKQPVSIRYLKPPTPPPPGPIVIRERRPIPPPPLPPQIIRQRLPRVRTPEPLVIRERPPTPPRFTKPLLIEKHLPPPPRPPRQVIIERFSEPRRPRKVIFEKWLKYKPPKRKIILEKAPEISLRPPPRNIIIEYSSPLAVSLPEYHIEGVFVADPLTYTYSPHDGELKVVDKIYDLPPLPAHSNAYSSGSPR